MNQSNNPIGRPSSYTPELGEKICDIISSSDLGLRRLHEKYEFFPRWSVLQRWLRTIPEFEAQYARARIQQADFFVNEIIDIAYSSTPVTVQCDKLKIDSIKWIASKLLPKKYGDLISEQNNEKSKEMDEKLDALRNELLEKHKKEY